MRPFDIIGIVFLVGFIIVTVYLWISVMLEELYPKNDCKFCYTNFTKDVLQTCLESYCTDQLSTMKNIYLELENKGSIGGIAECCDNCREVNPNNIEEYDDCVRGYCKRRKEKLFQAGKDQESKVIGEKISSDYCNYCDTLYKYEYIMGKEYLECKYQYCKSESEAPEIQSSILNRQFSQIESSNAKEERLTLAMIGLLIFIISFGILAYMKASMREDHRIFKNQIESETSYVIL